jgi:hypothetical protein
MPPRRRRALFWLLYPLYLAGAVLLLVYAVFRVRLAPLRRPDAAEWKRVTLPHVDDETLRLVGFLKPGREGSFMRFPETKPPGTIRVGCFGDSFTYGDEVPEGLDYPSFLRREMRRRGLLNVEVLNFGNSWHGLHQTFLMLERVGRRFDLDAAVLGPSPLFPERDETFWHAGLTAPYYLHARYVLSGDSLALEEVLGETSAERFETYHRFVPPMRYLRFDRRAPDALSCLLPGSLTIANPFYYSALSERDEAFETYRRLLLRAASAAPKPRLHFVNSDRSSVAELARIRHDNLHVEELSVPDDFPYAAAEGHHAAIGNALVAQEIADLLFGAAGEVQVLATAAPPAATAAPPLERLDSYARVAVSVAGRPVGELRDLDGLADVGRSDLSRERVWSLLALRPRGKTVLDSILVPLAREPANGWELRLVAGGTPRSLARIEKIADHLYGAEADVVEAGPRGGLRLKTDAQPALAGFRGLVSLLAGEDAVLSGTVTRLEPRPIMAPERGRAKRIRARGDVVLDVSTLPADGFVTLDFAKEGTVVSVPVAAYRRAALASRPKPARRIVE